MKREPFFANKAQRLLFKSCALPDMGDSAFVLFALISNTEDAAHYRGPVGFWDRQIADVLGWSEDKVTRVRTRLIDAGWLKYDRRHSRKQGRYQVLVPPGILQSLDDSPLEPKGELEEMVRMGAEYGWEKDRMGADHEEWKVRTGAAYPADLPADPTTLSLSRSPSSGKPDLPPATFPDHGLPDFQSWWESYPKRNGRRRGKKAAKALFGKIPADDRPDLMAATANYASETDPAYVKDPSRFLQADFWRDFLEPAEDADSAKAELNAILQGGAK